MRWKLSRSLAGAEDENTRIVRTNLRDEILKLKQEQGNNILVCGVDVPSQLMEHPSSSLTICFLPSVLFGDPHIQRMFVRRFTVPLN
jgi:hypothetical protein